MSRFDHIALLLHKLHWRPVKSRILYKLLLITYKALNNQVPPLPHYNLTTTKNTLSCHIG